MQSKEELIFDDPALKAALKRCCAISCAPQDLRNRVAQALLSASDDTTSEPAAPVSHHLTSQFIPPPQFQRDAQPRYFVFGGNTMIGMGVAAMLLVVIGIAGYRLINMSPMSVPADVSLAMVTRHDLCCGGIKHSDPTLPKVSIAQLGGVLQNQLGHSVMAADLATDGWTFRGVAKCPVGTTRSAHFLYSKGDETISVFSLPGNAYPQITGDHRYEATQANHAVVCYAHNGAVFGYVGYGKSGDLKMAELESLINKHQSDPIEIVSMAERATLALLIREER